MPDDLEKARRALIVANVEASKAFSAMTKTVEWRANEAAKQAAQDAEAEFDELSDTEVYYCEFCGAPLAGAEAQQQRLGHEDGETVFTCRYDDAGNLVGPCFKPMMDEITNA